MDYVVNLEWDCEASVWCATSNDIPGLVLESGSIDALIERVKIAAPEIMKMNNIPIREKIRFHIEDRSEKVYA